MSDIVKIMADYNNLSNENIKLQSENNRLNERIDNYKEQIRSYKLIVEFIKQKTNDKDLLKVLKDIKGE